MRRDYLRHGGRLQVLARHQVEGIRIQHPRYRGGQHLAQQGLPPGALAETRTEHDNGGFFQQRHKLVTVLDTAHHHFRLARQHQGTMVAARRQRYQPGTATRCGLRRHYRRAGITVVATNHQHMAKQTFMCRRPSRLECCMKRAQRRPTTMDLDLVVDTGRHAQVVKMQHAGERRAFTGEQAALDADKGNGVIRVHHFAGCRTAVGAQAGGNIQRQHRLATPVDGADQWHKLVAHRATQAGAQQAVDNHVGGGKICHLAITENHHRHAFLHGTQRHHFCIAAQLRWRHRGIHLRVQPGVNGQQRDHIAVAAVIAGTTDNRQVACFRPLLAQQQEGRLTGTGHEDVAGNAGLLNGDTIQLTRLRGGVQCLWHGRVAHE